MTTIKNQATNKEKMTTQQRTKSATDWIGDDIDHINVNNDALSKVGQMLSHRYEFTFNHSHFGRFRSLEAFEHYIRNGGRDDKLRSLSGEKLAAYVKNHQPLDVKIPNYRAVKMDALYQRILQQPELKQMVVNTQLPFDVYYVIQVSQLPVRPSFSTWMSKGLEEIRSALKDNREPDFMFLKDMKRAGIYDGILGIIKNPHAVEYKKKGI